MLLEQSCDWTTPEAYFPVPPTRWQLLHGLIERLWLEHRAMAVVRRAERMERRLRAASVNLPAYLRRDIGL